MVQGLRAVRWFGAALVLGLGLSLAHAADESVTLLPDTDLHGADYSILKDTDLDACTAACQEFMALSIPFLLTVRSTAYPRVG